MVSNKIIQHLHYVVPFLYTAWIGGRTPDVRNHSGNHRLLYMWKGFKFESLDAQLGRKLNGPVAEYGEGKRSFRPNNFTYIALLRHVKSPLPVEKHATFKPDLTRYHIGR